jgi:hypothetical protein
MFRVAADLQNPLFQIGKGSREVCRNRGLAYASLPIEGNLDHFFPPYDFLNLKEQKHGKREIVFPVLMVIPELSLISM